MKPSQVTEEKSLGGSLVSDQDKVEYRLWLKNALTLSADDTVELFDLGRVAQQLAGGLYTRRSHRGARLDIAPKNKVILTAALLVTNGRK